MGDNKPFEYTYSAKEQAEIKKIRDKYAAPQTDEMDKMERLRRLDASVTKKGAVASLIVGIVGAIVMGSGMSLVMTDIGATLGIADSMLIGIIVGVIGMVGVALAYPVYDVMTKKQRKKVAPEIIRLTDELLK